MDEFEKVTLNIHRKSRGRKLKKGKYNNENEGLTLEDMISPI